MIDATNEQLLIMTNLLTRSYSGTLFPVFCCIFPQPFPIASFLGHKIDSKSQKFPYIYFFSFSVFHISIQLASFGVSCSQLYLLFDLWQHSQESCTQTYNTSIALTIQFKILFPTKCDLLLVITDLIGKSIFNKIRSKYQVIDFHIINSELAQGQFILLNKQIGYLIAQCNAYFLPRLKTT